MIRENSRLYLLTAAATIAFIVWGSLFPLKLRASSLVEARDLLWNTRTLLFNVSAWSLTDVISNTALFAALGLFVSAALERNWGFRRSLLPVVVVASVAVSISLELAQAYVIRRSPSLLDVAAALAGTIIGLAIWRRYRDRVDAVAGGVERTWVASTRFERALLLYSGLFACAWLAPFDITIRPHEIVRKYEHQRLLLPLSASPDAASTARLALMLVAAIPLGVVARVCGCPPGVYRSLPHAAALATLSLVALEIAQVPVFSRTTDATEVLVAIPGITLGALVGAVPKVTTAQ